MAKFGNHAYENHVLIRWSLVSAVLLALAMGLPMVGASHACGSSPPNDNPAGTPSEPSQNNVARKVVDDVNMARDAERGVVLRVKTDPQSQGGRVVIIAAVENRGKVPFRWDGEFCALIQWKVSADKNNLIEPTKLRSGSRDNEINVRNRFVEIPPGGVVSKKIDLTDQVRIFWHERAALASPDGSSVVVPQGGEDLARFVIPPEAETIRISFEYQGRDDDAADGFAVYYGVRPEELRAPRVHVKSNEIRINVRAGTKGR